MPKKNSASSAKSTEKPYLTVNLIEESKVLKGLRDWGQMMLQKGELKRLSVTKNARSVEGWNGPEEIALSIMGFIRPWKTKKKK